MPGKPVTDQQMKLYMSDRVFHSQRVAAARAGFSERTARRYENKSLAIAANQPFSAWDKIFPDKAVTVAAIDRLVHHAPILEMNFESYRRRSAESQIGTKQKSTSTAKT